MSPTQNIVREVDLKILGKDHMYTRAIDDPTEPEGILSTFPAIVNALLGYWSGLLIQRHAGVGKPFLQLLLGGAALFFLGWLWGQYFPINKKLWTSSFVLLSSGFSMMALSVCLLVFDGLGLKHLARPFEIVGVNAIFVYVASGVLARVLGITGAGAWIYSHLFSSNFANPVVASHMSAVATVAFWWIILWLMSRKGWTVRV